VGNAHSIIKIILPTGTYNNFNFKGKRNQGNGNAALPIAAECTPHCSECGALSIISHNEMILPPAAENK